MLPGDFAPWQTVYYYFRKWNKWKRQGLIERLLSATRRKAREDAGREAEPSAVIIDCQSVPITRSGGLCGSSGGNKKVKGRKRHVVTDTQGPDVGRRRSRRQRTRKRNRFRLDRKG